MSSVLDAEAPRVASSSTTKAQPRFELHEVSGQYDEQHVLGPLSLTIRAGERVGLVGRSGVGKSTLISLMQTNWADRAALIPQALGLVDTFSVFHNIYMGQLDRHSVWYNLLSLIRPMARERQAVGGLLDTLGMTESLYKPAGELSGGQRQRVAIARALFQQAGSRRPLMLLADEPVSALDNALTEIAMDALCQRFATAVVALHDTTLALRYCDRILGLADGQIVIDEPSHRLSSNELHALY